MCARTQLFDWHLANLEVASGADPAQLSARHWNIDDAAAYEGGRAAPRHGFAALAASLAAGLGSSVRRAAAASVVEHPADPDLRCRVRLAAPGGGAEEGDVVIVTVPLGVLKAGEVLPGMAHARRGAGLRAGANAAAKGAAKGALRAVVCDQAPFTADRPREGSQCRLRRMARTFGCLCADALGAGGRQLKFEPELPACKRQAIERLGVGLINKVRGGAACVCALCGVGGG